MEQKHKDLARAVLRFDSMLTPKIITVVYWLLLLAVVLGALGTIFSGEIFGGIGLLIGGGVFARIWCELMIVLFKINENIQKMADRG